MLRIDDDQRVVRGGIRDFIGRIDEGRWDVLPLPDRLRLGQVAHEAYRAAAPDVESEVTVRLRFSRRGFTFIIQGRVDGLRRLEALAQVEEVKSVSLEGAELLGLSEQDFPLACLQLRLYCYALHAEGTFTPSAFLVARSIFSGEERRLPVVWGVEEVEDFLTLRAAEILDDHQARQRARHRRRRIVGELPFPFEVRRPAQELIVTELEDALSQGRPFLLQAPTGTGKTAVALYAALKAALREGGRVLFTTAKTTGQSTAEQTVRLMQARGAELSCLTLSSRARSCLLPVMSCHPDHCRFCEGYHAKLRRTGIVLQLGQPGMIDAPRLRAVGESMELCPYELSTELADRADVLICDFNYLFHPTIRLSFLDEAPGEEPLFVVIDEAHNLATRAREYHSPTLPAALLERLVQAGRDRGGVFGRRMAGIGLDLLEDLRRWQSEAGLDGLPEGRSSWEVEAQGFERACMSLTRLLLDDPMRRVRRPMVGEEDVPMEALRRLTHFVRVLGLLDGKTFLPWVGQGPDSGVGVLCLDAGPHLRPLMKRFTGVVAMSATLAPMDFFREALGLDEQSVSADFPSPFPREHLGVFIADEVTTRWGSREKSLPRVAELIREVIHLRPGTYAVYVPSYEYVRNLRIHLDDGEVELLLESPELDPILRKALLMRLDRWSRDEAHGGRARLLVAVQGGSLAESVEWPAGVLQGIFVVGPGIPRPDFEQQSLSRYYEQTFGRGFEYAYLYPGMARVIQAAGRLIRRPEDVGIVVLMDERFRWRSYARALPRHWYERSVDELVKDDLIASVASFWRRVAAPNAPQ